LHNPAASREPCCANDCVGDYLSAGPRHGEVPPRGELKSPAPPPKSAAPAKRDGNSCIIINLF